MRVKQSCAQKTGCYVVFSHPSSVAWPRRKENVDRAIQLLTEIYIRLCCDPNAAFKHEQHIDKISQSLNE